ncbi:MAG: hypothetical protein JWL87_599 [Candidatus Adlerbacteria bacterium]|nr:hypothetical protein [Candidatus Adlerbacteria bacterium]
MKKFLILALLLLPAGHIAQAQFNPTFISPTPAATDYTCADGQTYSSTGGFWFWEKGGCVPTPSNSASTAQKVTECMKTGGLLISEQTHFSQCAKETGYTGSLTDIKNPSATTPTTQTQTQPINPNAFCQGGKCTYIPLEPLPGLPNIYGPNQGQGSFQSLITSSFQLLLGAGATLAVVMLVLGALTYMFSDVVGNKTKALGRIRGAMWAIVLLMSSYLILNTINPELVTFKLNLSSITSGQNAIQQITPQQTAEAINNKKVNDCQNQSSGTQICTVHYPTSNDWQCLCANGNEV